MRRLLCRIGAHHWQYLLAPPTWRGQSDRYEPGIFCIFCTRRSRHEPGSLGAGRLRARALGGATSGREDRERNAVGDEYDSSHPVR